MSEVFAGEGSCLCGAVSFTAKEANKNMGACHCGMCRKWGGSPAMLVSCEGDVSFSGEDSIAVFNSSELAERGFCKSCGSNLFFRVKETRQHFIPAGLFDDQSSFSFERQIFIDRKPRFYAFGNNTTVMTEAEFFGQE